MTLEEYHNSDWYKESHPYWNYKPTREEKIENEMRQYLGCIDAYRERVNNVIEAYEKEEKDIPYESYNNRILPEDCDSEERIVRYVTLKLWNGRMRGILATGNYYKCALARYNYNVACIDSEWDWASVERIEAKDEDEFDEILISYREEVEHDDIYGYDYDEY